MMHLTCTNMPVEQLDGALARCREAGVTNILALRGDPPKGQETFAAVEGGFACALDLVKHIRAGHGDFFGIAVAGYPEAHPDAIVLDDEAKMAENYAKDVAYLKEKCDAGADLVVTQLFYDVALYFQFVKDCRAAGITVPIIPGIMPIMTYGGFKRMTSFCKTKVPAEVAAAVEARKDDDDAVREYGIELGTADVQGAAGRGSSRDPPVHTQPGEEPRGDPGEPGAGGEEEEGGGGEEGCRGKGAGGGGCLNSPSFFFFRVRYNPNFLFFAFLLPLKLVSEIATGFIK